MRDEAGVCRHLKEGEPGEGHRPQSEDGIFQLCCVSSKKPVSCFNSPSSFDDLVYADDSLLLQEAFGAVTYSFPLLPGSPRIMAILISFLEIDSVSP